MELRDGLLRENSYFSLLSPYGVTSLRDDSNDRPPTPLFKRRNYACEADAPPRLCEASVDIRLNPCPKALERGPYLGLDRAQLGAGEGLAFARRAARIHVE